MLVIKAARLPCAAQALACFIWADLRQEPSGVSLTPPHGVGTARGSALSRKVPQLRERQGGQVQNTSADDHLLGPFWRPQSVIYVMMLPGRLSMFSWYFPPRPSPSWLVFSFFVSKYYANKTQESAGEKRYSLGLALQWRAPLVQSRNSFDATLLNSSLTPESFFSLSLSLVLLSSKMVPSRQF